MISDARRAWLKDNLHTFVMRRLPNLVKSFDMWNRFYKKQQDYLLDEGFHDRVKVVKQKAAPYLWAYLAGCCAPVHHRRKPARSS